MIGIVVFFSLAAAGILLMLGLADLAISWRASDAAMKAVVTEVATLTRQSRDDTGTLDTQAAIDVKGAWEALASLAAALKNLDRSSRLVVLSLAFIAVAAFAAGVGDIAEAIALRLN